MIIARATSDTFKNDSLVIQVALTNAPDRVLPCSHYQLGIQITLQSETEIDIETDKTKIDVSQG
jgi:hypothetical protein